MVTDLTALFGALADTRRRAILDLLNGRTLTVNRIAEEFSVSRPAISRHLRILRENGLVREEKRGRERFYALDPSAIGEAMEHLRPYLARGREKLAAAGPASGGPVSRQAASSAEPASDPDDGWRCW